MVKQIDDGRAIHSSARILWQWYSNRTWRFLIVLYSKRANALMYVLGARNTQTTFAIRQYILVEGRSCRTGLHLACNVKIPLGRLNPSCNALLDQISFTNSLRGGRTFLISYHASFRRHCAISVKRRCSRSSVAIIMCHHSGPTFLHKTRSRRQIAAG